jgi:uncharacterized protein
MSFAVASALGVGVATATARWARGGSVAWLMGILLSVHAVISVGVHALMPSGLQWIFWGLQALFLLYVTALLWPAQRGVLWQRWVEIPAHWFAVGTFLATPWALSALAPAPLPAVWFPYLVATTGLLHSMWTRTQTVTLDLTVPLQDEGGAPERHPRMMEVQGGFSERHTEDGAPLRIVQLTDPHLGAFMSVDRLRLVCERAVAADPDLILLTGDFLTLTTRRDPHALASALAPLADHAAVYACFGNHDHEAPAVVSSALAAVGARLLVDQRVVVTTRWGPVEVVGFDFRWRDRAQHLHGVLASMPRSSTGGGVPMMRVAMLHDPGAFKHLPEGAADLVLSGHTHGGHVGLVSLGLNWTFVYGLAGIPDHGAWALGPNRLYVHRGTGHYGFPLRLGVPAEESLLLVHGNKSRA